LERNRTVKDYLDLLEEGTGLLLVGGQAVNIWAELYRAKEPAILEYLPFTSGDADFYRRAQKLKLPPNWKELPLPTKGRMRIVANVLEGPEGQKAEVIRSVNGLTQQEVEDGSIPITYADRPMWFLVPSALFQAKLENLKSIAQEGRQDVKHFKLLIPVTRCFFDDLLQQHNSTERPTRAIGWMSQHAQNVQEAIKLGHHEATDWNSFFPIERMQEHPSEAVRNFAKYQLKPNT
jgi:hypothetical protein